MYNLLMNFICAFVGTICFAMLYNVNKRYYFSVGMIGGIGFVIFLLLEHCTSPVTATFIASIFVVLASRILAVYMKCPITIFLVSGILAILPSPRIFYTAYYIINNQPDIAYGHGIYAVKIVFSIVLAIAFILSIPRNKFVFKKR